MEENFSWEIVFIAVIFSLLTLGVAYYFISPKENAALAPLSTEHFAEYKNTKIAGRKHGQKSWEFTAKSGWTSKDQQYTNLYQVTRGQIYSQGKLAVADLKAAQARIWRNIDVVEALASAESRVTARLDLKNLAEQTASHEEWAKVTANQIKFIPNDKRTEIVGQVKLTKPGTNITADRFTINHEQKSALFEERVIMRRRDGRLYSKTLEYFGQTEQLIARANVRFDIKEKRLATSLKCNQLNFNNDLSQDAVMTGSVEVVQGKKTAWAPEGIYSNREKVLNLKGGVTTVITKAGALLQLFDPIKLQAKETRKLLQERTIIQSDELTFSTRSGDAKATGQVTVSQKNQEAKADQAVYDEKQQLLTLGGNVFLKKGAGQEWVKCRQVIVSITKETFEAIGSVEAQFKL